MDILVAAIASAAMQTAPAAPAAHAQHSPTQQAQSTQQQSHDHKCCKEVNGKMECQMMKGHEGHSKGAGESPGGQKHNH